MQASARLATSAASKRVVAGVSSAITRSCYRASRGKAHAAPLSAQEPSIKGQKRISKRERGILIEELVEKYRASNEGKFPTITFVRQQIGGSHYTVREILQELEYNHANPLRDSAKSSRGQVTTEFPKHSRSTDFSEAGHVQASAQLTEHSYPKDDDGKNQHNPESFRNDEQDDVLLSLKDVTAGTTTIEKTDTQRSMGSSDRTVETEAAKPDFSISDSIKSSDVPNLSNQTENDSVKNLTNDHAPFLEMADNSGLGSQEGKTEINKLDLNNTGNSMNASKSPVSDQSASDKVLKRNTPDSEHGPKHENKESTNTGLLGSLKSFAYGLKNFWKSM